MLDKVLFVLEIIGTIAFAVSGAFVAIKAKFDVFGVIVVGCVTAVGGGIMRDVLIGQVPPAIFSKGYLVGIASVAALTVFCVAYFRHKRFDDMVARVDRVNNLFDAIGLAAFTVMGVEVAFSSRLSDNAFLSVIIGVLTGVGGGLLRDVFTENLPYIFKKHVYAIASLCGALLYYYLRGLQAVVAAFAGIAFIIVVRILATKFRWSLPKVVLEPTEVGMEDKNHENGCDNQADRGARS